MNELFAQRIVPLASIADPAHVQAIGDGLVDGGLPVVEVALRGSHGAPALAALAARGDLLVGAGTVLSVEQARGALDAGAAFVVTPGLDAEVVRYVTGAGVPVVPGVLTPTEVQAAVTLGLDRLKLFPAGVFGGLALLDAYRDVYRSVRFMPSGGVRQDNLAEHLAHPSVFAASGSWITAAAGDGREAVAERARAAREAAG
ncbi:bifunctional 4-hydroxy-2-oxoglutarate aldolase/2-dehydro-3-deoxy-phosphogluconate aldolase [Microbacterium sp. C5A9]|uniref:bifunctional 4-hydroxy-2-oxoglutarate aldolase/2-dehydro-3-deoxy-phosphogluconate aldolase n=1 Tax=Microbacterium sp. C5A9 TaxID=2736663 RepID=UPI001F51C798|nr:bifunctional 4-hydroxy-2-oxoglutarate aldolase/2-dehydro-3-deoxy-phosphogluconate aldolase [Microbacterium sp. C5A9]MCI1017237.1 bifunctional 4-hydroxy-2-oxoglutarate aldolase/2-dehydro-3-deoxy-phosphogluconate aldolase [Microbacterium sp. C5A9]